MIWYDKNAFEVYEEVFQLLVCAISELRNNGKLQKCFLQ